MVTSLAEIQEQLVAALGVRCSESVEDMMKQWLPSTWRSLYDVLRRLELEELSQQIEEYLSCE